MAASATLPSLTPLEAVADTLHRCVLGIDTNDRDLFASACVQDETMAIIFRSGALEGWSTISAFFERLYTLVTLHMVSNVRVALEDGADKASLTAHAVAYHVRPEEAHTQEDTAYTAGNLYFIDLVKDAADGLWKIKRWEIRTLWTTGDRAVLYG